MQVGFDGRPPLPGQRFAAKSRSCKAAVPKGAAKRVVPRVPCSLNLQALVSQGFRLERREPFRISAFWKQACPLRHGLRRATSPKVRGLGSTAKFPVLPRAPPLGELSNECETERARNFPFYISRPMAHATWRHLAMACAKASGVRHWAPSLQAWRGS